MKKGKIQVYKPKSLIDGAQIKLAKGVSYVAVPDKFAGRKIYVKYGGTTMVIRDWRGEAVMFRRFRDKFWNSESKRPQYYTLGYFIYKPNTEEKY